MISFYFIPVVIFITMMFLLMVLNVKDSVGKINNALLAFYIGISMYVALMLTTLMTPFFFMNSIKKIYPPEEFYQYSLYFVLALGGIYVIRRQDWWDRLINGIRSWKSGHPDNDAQKVLIEHAIKCPEDRAWAKEMVKALKTKGDVKKNAPKEGGSKGTETDKRATALQESTEAFPVILPKDG